MRRRPSPSLVVSIIALVFAAAGTSIAAVNFAKNAGAVDGKSAVSGSASNARAAGKLVATGKSGKIPAKFLSVSLAGLIRGGAASFHQAVDVVDNGNAAPVQIAGPPYGTLTVTCGDQNNQAGTENARATFAFANSSGQTLNLSRSANNAAPTIVALATGSQDSATLTNESTFRYHVELNGNTYLVEGVFRDDGNGSTASNCLVYGYVIALSA